MPYNIITSVIGSGTINIYRDEQNPNLVEINAVANNHYYFSKYIVKGLSFEGKLLITQNEDFIITQDGDNLLLTIATETEIDNTPLQLELERDIEVVAYFNEYAITINFDEDLGNAYYVWNADNSVELTAVPNSNVQFLGWYLNSELISKNLIIDYPVNSDITFEAKFGIVYDVTINQKEIGTVVLTRNAEDRNIITLTASTEEEGYSLSEYLITNSVGTYSTSDNPYTTTIVSNIYVDPIFEFGVWREPIIDRTEADLLERNTKAYLNFDDVNRIEWDSFFIVRQFFNRTHPEAAELTFKYDWNYSDILNRSNLTRIRNNILTLVHYIRLSYELPEIGKTIDYNFVNELEKALLYIYNYFKHSEISEPFADLYYSDEPILLPSERSE